MADAAAPNGTSVRSRHFDFLLLGGGVASAVAAETLRTEGATGSILILSDENVPPYHRPPLSKQMLVRKDHAEHRFFVHPEGFYREKAIDLQLDTRAVAVDPADHFVTTSTGDRIGYGRLLIATGATPIPLLVPGATLAGVHVLRRKADAEAIQQSATNAKRAVVLGGSFLGVEIALSLIDLGLEVTIVERGPVLFPHLEAPSLSAYFQHYAESRGASVLLNDTASALFGHERVQEIETTSARRILCDLVVISIGVAPASEFLRDSGIALDQGRVVVDAQLRTSTADVYAAGDVTAFYDPVFVRRRHIEHWDNAVKQGRLAARNMLGRRLLYDEISYFFCEVGEITFNVLGATEEADEWIERGSLDNRSFAMFYLKRDVPRALFSLGRAADETRLAEGLIRYRVDVGAFKQRLHDPSFALQRAPTQTALILQGGAALGAFECGVVKALEEEGIFPDIVAGVSIGAFNGAIIASNPRRATQALEAFWAELAITTVGPPVQSDGSATRLAQIMTFGVPKFFRPRWMQLFWPRSELPTQWTSFYDTSPMLELIAKYVDFPSLKSSPVRLLISAVDVATAELEVFDSYVDDLTPSHILASGSLPPAFPWTQVDGKTYWDGGIVSNSPLDLVIDRCGPDGKRVFIVDLFSSQSPLPSNMMEVLVRRDEIVYSERVRSDLRHREMVGAYRKLIDRILARLEPAEMARIKHLPEYIQLMGDGAPTSITRVVRTGPSGQPASLDYDFSTSAIHEHQAEGYAVAKKAICR